MAVRLVTGSTWREGKANSMSEDKTLPEPNLTKLILGPSASDDQDLQERLLASVWDEPPPPEPDPF